MGPESAKNHLLSQSKSHRGSRGGSFSLVCLTRLGSLPVVNGLTTGVVSFFQLNFPCTASPSLSRGMVLCPCTGSWALCAQVSCASCHPMLTEPQSCGLLLGQLHTLSLAHLKITLQGQGLRMLINPSMQHCIRVSYHYCSASAHYNKCSIIATDPRCCCRGHLCLS